MNDTPTSEVNRGTKTNRILDVLRSQQLGWEWVVTDLAKAIGDSSGRWISGALMDLVKAGYIRQTGGKRKGPRGRFLKVYKTEPAFVQMPLDMARFKLSALRSERRKQFARGTPSGSRVTVTTVAGQLADFREAVTDLLVDAERRTLAVEERVKDMEERLEAVATVLPEELKKAVRELDEELRAVVKRVNGGASVLPPDPEPDPEPPVDPLRERIEYLLSR